MTRVLLEPLGDHACRFRVPASVDRRALLDSLRATPDIIDAVVTEAYAAFRFDAPIAALDLDSLLASCAEASRQEPTTHTIEVRYGGPDLEAVAERAGIAPEAWCDAHESLTHTVSFVGFMPGFLYLRGLPAELDAPRLPVPRTRVPANSLAIAGGFTGVYPFACPGGWNLVGEALDHAPFADGRLRYAVGDQLVFRRRR